MALRLPDRRVREETRRADAGLPPSGSFEAVARDWLSTIHTAKVSTGHADRTRIRLEQDVFPRLGRRPIGEIKAPELLHRGLPGVACDEYGAAFRSARGGAADQR